MSDDKTKHHPFRIASRPPAGGANGQAVSEQDVDASPLQRIDRMVGSSDLFLFIKGSPQSPQCGFSANVVRIIDGLGVPYKTFDVLSDEGIRLAAKEYADWPTFPQVYLRGEFIGGNDIVSELAAQGVLQRKIGSASDA
jgi:monothiol glutaredoxin